MLEDIHHVEQKMRSHGRCLLFVVCALSVIDTLAQTLTLTFLNGPTVIQVFTTNPANGLPIRTIMATLSGSTSPTPSPSLETSDMTLSPSISQASQTTSSGNPNSPVQLPATGMIAGILGAVVVLLAIAFGLFFFKRRKRLRRRRRSVRLELDPIESPGADKQCMMDPFITDVQARGLGCDLSLQSTKRIDAKFMAIDQLPRTSIASSGSSSDAHARRPAPLSPSPVPGFLLTREGDLIARPITPSSSGDHDSPSLASHTTTTQHGPAHVKYSLPLASTPFPTSMPDTLTETSTSRASQAEIAQRMRDILAQLGNHAAAPTSDNSGAVIQLQQDNE